jgi:hypothetical protein
MAVPSGHLETIGSARFRLTSTDGFFAGALLGLGSGRRLAILLLAVALITGPIGIDFAQAVKRGAVTGGVPNFDIKRTCRTSSFPGCSDQEQVAREMLIKEWPRFTAQEKSTCAEDEKQGRGLSSYVGWITCLQTIENNRKISATEKIATPAAKTGSDTGGTSSPTHRSRRQTAHRHDRPRMTSHR